MLARARRLWLALRRLTTQAGPRSVRTGDRVRFPSPRTSRPVYGTVLRVYPMSAAVLPDQAADVWCVPTDQLERTAP